MVLFDETLTSVYMRVEHALNEIAPHTAPGLSDPVSTAGDRRGDESHCGGGAGCESRISIPNLSTPTLISSVYSSEVCGHLGLYSLL